MTKQWGEIDCPQCKKPMRADALKCPYCQTEYTPIQAGLRKQQNDKDNRDTLKGCFVLIVIAVGIWWLFFSGDDEAEEVRPAEKIEAGIAEKYDKELILNDLEVCINAEIEIQKLLENKGQKQAYDAAINAKNECERFSAKSGPKPFRCDMFAVSYANYYDRLAVAIDTLDTKPSTVKELEDGRIFTGRKLKECLAEIEQNPK